MSVYESISIALFIISIVFTVLVALSLFLKLQSKFFNFLQSKKSSNVIDLTENDIELSTIKNTFMDVDDETVAIIIASISHVSNIPLNSLKIKSIKPLNL